MTKNNNKNKNSILETVLLFFNILLIDTTVVLAFYHLTILFGAPETRWQVAILTGLTDMTVHILKLPNPITEGHLIQRYIARYIANLKRGKTLFAALVCAVIGAGLGSLLCIWLGKPEMLSVIAVTVGLWFFTTAYLGNDDQDDSE